MSTLAEIEAAVATLRRPEQEVLLRHLSAMLQPPARSLSAGRKAGWPVPPPKVNKTESARIQRRIEAEFGRVEAENWT